ncbi:MogA/MoaB family molybdenum cofactor biosynthesis protein [bacterium]|nr:MogA/MoaB family molybdenum cofactor biosynthesis protein [bacterium]
MYSLAVITVSDKCSKGLREDASGALIVEFAKEYGFKTVFTKIVPDEFFDIVSALNLAVENNANLIITTGGTGFSPRDITPEATKSAIEREAMGVAEALRNNSSKYTPKAMLSRGVCGIKNRSIIVNLPGSPKAVKENLEFLLPNIKHGIDILTGAATECARKE